MISDEAICVNNFLNCETLAAIMGLRIKVQSMGFVLYDKDDETKVLGTHKTILDLRNNLVNIHSERKARSDAP